ncbi:MULTISPECIES: class 1b ribonucleoside-diphosphate reductase subunit beta [unclassified Lysinibacillus]|uniref:class 1b ribonucleoside-diphosphate reductase subunit beta n=1 Tax=unclassified Lysinibacillus TaxID=2636778 RepID=UPI0038169A18
MKVLSERAYIQKRFEKVFEAVNWNKQLGLHEVFWKQQVKQFWLPEEVAVSKDLLGWKQFEFQVTYMRVLAGLTLLDTIQTNVGMNELSRFVKNLQQKALYSLFGAFEAIHAKSYSYIFTTLATNSQIDEVFEWVKNNPYLQYKAREIEAIYSAIKEDDDVSLWKAHFSSVMLESFLFYSGFFYPLYLGGHGILKNSAEVISLIVRDESIHGVAVGYEAQEMFKTFDKATQDELKIWGYELLADLYMNELKYTDDVYAETGVGGKVKAYVRYNANKALMNLGLDTMFPGEEVDPIVMNGIRTDSVTHDFFSQKGNSYTMANVAPITDETFYFKGINI